MRNIYRATYLFLLNTPTITADSTIVIIVKNAVSNERLANICPTNGLVNFLIRIII